MASASLNQAQRNHAVDRIKAMAEAKVTELHRANFVAAVCLPPEKKVSLIKTGKVKLRADVDWTDARYTAPINLYDFSKFEKAGHVTPVGQKKIDSIQKEKQKAIDMIMLAGASEALTALASFEASLSKV